MTFTSENIYNLLPSVYRIRDSERGEPLKALVEILADVAGQIENDITNLYENWFIETCNEWVVPYIGDLLGVKGLHSFTDTSEFSSRARVANTIRYRRRKGTATMLEQLAYDTTGWRARVVEFFQLLETTQYYNHIRIKNFRTPDLRLTNQLELIDTPFDTAAHTGEVRNIAKNRGYYNIPNLGIFLWRIQSYFISKCSARSAAASPDGRYTFSQIGKDSPLFNRPQTETEITSLAGEINVPGILRRRPLLEELESRRQFIVDNPTSLRDSLTDLRNALISGSPFTGALQDLDNSIAGGRSALFEELQVLSRKLSDGAIHHSDALEIIFNALKTDHNTDGIYFGTQPVFQIYVKDRDDTPLYQLLPEEILICNLTEPGSPIPGVWRRPPETKLYTPSDGGPQVALTIKAAVDPLLGRIAFPLNIIPAEVLVSYAYGFSGDTGGGPYNRGGITMPEISGTPDWQVAVSSELPPQTGIFFSSLSDAISEWNNLPEGRFGIITIIDNYTYEDISSAKINIPAASKLIITGARWDQHEINGELKRIPGNIDPDGIRPHIRSDVVIAGTAKIDNPSPGEIILDGLLIEGKVTVENKTIEQLGTLKIYHSTLVPENGGIKVSSSNNSLRILIKRSICGSVLIQKLIGGIQVEDSIIDGKSVKAISVRSADLEVEKCTFFGDIECRSITAGNSIFTGKINSRILQSGCLRYSYVSDKIKTPRRFNCQPDLAIITSPEIPKDIIRSRLIPNFTSEIYGTYGYAQLSVQCPAEIKTGADDGSEMGVFGYLKQPQREANLRSSINEYLRIGLQAGLIFVT